MTRARGGLSLLEILIAALILAVLAGSAFDLFSMQRHEVYTSEQERLAHGYAIERLAEEESRLNVTRFASASALAPSTWTGSGALRAKESLSVAPVPDCTGLYTLTIRLEYGDAPTAGTRTLTLSKLVVDRDALTRLPAQARGLP